MNGRRLSAVLGFLFVLGAGAATLAHEAKKDDRWTTDGFLYARMMLVDLGRNQPDARDEARRFY